jgi:hypothetical protein
MKEEEKKCTRIRERKGKGRARGVCCAGTGLRGGGKEQYPGELGIEGLSVRTGIEAHLNAESDPMKTVGWMAAKALS